MRTPDVLSALARLIGRCTPEAQPAPHVIEAYLTLERQRREGEPLPSERLGYLEERIKALESQDAIRRMRA